MWFCTKVNKNARSQAPNFFTFLFLFAARGWGRGLYDFVYITASLVNFQVKLSMLSHPKHLFAPRNCQNKN